MRRFVVGKDKSKNKKYSPGKDAEKDDVGESDATRVLPSPLPSCSSPESSVTSSLTFNDVTEDSTPSSNNLQRGDDDVKSPKSEDQNSGFGFKVHVRIKPLEEQEIANSSINRLRSVHAKGAEDIVLSTRPSLKKERSGNRHCFSFDHVLDETSTQKDTYDVTTLPLVEMTLQGYHSCLVTYGSPATGKSHALFGKASSGKYKGNIIRAADAMMASIDKKAKNVKAELTMSFLQIYNEKIYDILDPSATDNIKFHDVSDVHTLEGVTEWPIETTEDVTKQLRRNPNRLRDAGRSHTIFTLHFRKEEELNPEDDSHVKSFRTIDGRLDFVDLIGVNRPTKHSTHDSTGNNATAKANKSLQVFSNVIWALTDKDPQPPPYRDSRLTRLLREALGGNCVTRLLVTVSACPNSAHESLTSLLFAKRAMGVKNFPAPYVSVEEIKEEVAEETPSDDKVALVQNREASFASDSSTTPISMSPITSLATSSDKSIVMSAITSPAAKEKSMPTGTLPPINAKASILANPLFNESLDSHGPNLNEGKEGNTPSTPTSNDVETPPESKNKSKRESKRRSSKEYVDAEANRKSDKSKRSRRKSKSKNPDSPATSPPYWQINVTGNELQNGQVVALPQIATPDQLRHDTSSHGDVIAQEGKHRRKSTSRKHSPLTDSVMPSCSSTDLRDRVNPTRTPPTPGKGEHETEPKPSYPEESILYKSSSKSHEITERKEAFSIAVQPPSSPSEVLWAKMHATGSSHQTDSNICCMKCREREEKIKRDYDRMILFSKKDRDAKQGRIEELEVMLLKAHSESAPLVELQRMAEEKVKDRQAMTRLKELIENYKIQISSMISSSEYSNLQELRRKESAILEDQRKQFEVLRKNAEEQTNGASKMLSKKSEQCDELKLEIERLKRDLKEKDGQHKAYVEKLQATLNQTNVDKEKVESKHQTSMKEVTVKLSCASSQLLQLQEQNAEMMMQHGKEKDTFQREISKLTKQVEEMTKSKGKSSEEKNKSNTSLKCDSSTNTEDVRSRLNGLAYSVQCLRCAAQASIDDEDATDTESVRDAELRILLVQDTKNRELLLQLKRERNLLRDVMKIMYCRQWFTEEGSPHVKRTLRRVGIDTRELTPMKKC